MNTTNNPGGNNYDGPLRSPYLNWDRKDEDEQDDIKDELYDDYSDPYGGH